MKAPAAAVAAQRRPRHQLAQAARQQPLLNNHFDNLSDDDFKYDRLIKNIFQNFVYCKVYMNIYMKMISI